MVLTQPDFRRRGLARGLVSDLLEEAERLGLETLKLDATDGGRGLYESLGFRAEQSIERWQLRSGCDEERKISSALLVPDLDTEACGYDRGPLLASVAAVSDAGVGSDGLYWTGRGASAGIWVLVSRGARKLRNHLWKMLYRATRVVGGFGICYRRTVQLWQSRGKWGLRGHER